MKTYHRHQDKHAGKLYYCSMCPKSFTTLHSTKSHEFTHQGDRPWKCHCGQTFTRKYHLLRHELLHKGKREHICDVCGKTFMLKQGLTLHMHTHKQTKAHCCNLCGQFYTDARILKSHMKIHANQRDFVCEICSRSFVQKKTYLIHMKRHKSGSIHLKAMFKSAQHFCKLCSKGFADTQGLRRHMRRHENGTLKSDNKLKTEYSVTSITNAAPRQHSHVVPLTLPELSRENNTQELCSPDNKQSTENLSNATDKHANVVLVHVSTIADSGKLVRHGTFQRVNINDAVDTTKEKRKTCHENDAHFVEHVNSKQIKHCKQSAYSSGDKSTEADNDVLVNYIDSADMEDDAFTVVQDKVGKCMQNIQHSQPSDSSGVEQVEAEVFEEDKTVQNRHRNTVNVSDYRNTDTVNTSDGHTAYNSSSLAEEHVTSGTSDINSLESLGSYTPSFGNQGQTTKISKQTRSRFNKRFKCKQCLKHFHMMSTLRHHMALHRSNTGALGSRHEKLAHYNQTVSNIVVCSLCGSSFPSKFQYLIHVKKLHKNSINTVSVNARSTVKERPSDGDSVQAQTIESNMQNENGDRNNERDMTMSDRPVTYTAYVIKPDDNVASGSSNRDTGDRIKEHYKSKTDQTSCKILTETASPKRTKKVKKAIDLMCERCGLLLKSQITLQNHILLNTCAAKFSCKTCNRNFETKQKLMTHIQTQHDSNPYKCPICSKAFRSRSGLNKHRIKHKDGSENVIMDKRFMCTTCGKRYTSNDNLKIHMYSHDKTRPFPCTDTNCNMQFSQRAHMLRHVRMCHERKKDVPCTVEGCYKSFSEQFKLREHLRTHSGERQFRCTDCHKYFTTTSILRTHIRTQHQKLRKFLCHLCYQDFTAKHSLVKHLQRHAAEQKVNDTCDNKLDHSDASRSTAVRVKPVRKMQPKTHHCSQCDRWFTTKKGLKVHERIRCVNILGSLQDSQNEKKAL